LSSLERQDPGRAASIPALLLRLGDEPVLPTFEPPQYAESVLARGVESTRAVICGWRAYDDSIRW
jgi:hypothetical protein